MNVYARSSGPRRACRRGSRHRRAGVDVDAVADGDVGDLVADLGDDAGGVEAEDGGQLRQREVGEPLGVDRQDVLQVGHDVAGGDLDDDVGGAGFRGGDPLELHRVADLVQAGGEHVGHGCLLSGWAGRGEHPGASGGGPLWWCAVTGR